MKNISVKFIMIHFILIGSSVLPLLLNSCSHEAETSRVVTKAYSYSKDHDYKFRWNANPEPDMDHYLIYGWHGTEPNETPFIDSSDASNYDTLFIQKVPHQFNTPIIRDTIAYVANGDWLHFAVAAVNKAGKVSKIGISNFLKSETTNRGKRNPENNSGAKGQSDVGVSF